MRGLLRAALLAPSVVSTYAVHHVEATKDLDSIQVADVIPITGHSSAIIHIPIPSDDRSPDSWATESLVFQFDVLPSQEICGYGNTTIDGQALPQQEHNDVWSGKGEITTDRKNVIDASWSFNCVEVNGVPGMQFLKFNIARLDGIIVQDVGFSALFVQTGSTKIMNIITDMTVPDQIAANPNPESLMPASGETDEFPQYSIEQDVAELDWLMSQLRELEYLISQKQQMIAKHASEHFKEDIKSCDSLKCVITAVGQKVRYAAYKVYEKLRGEDDEPEEEEWDGFPKPPFKNPHFKKPHFPKFPHHGKGNHTCPPKHGKGNHTHPPHHRRPHHWLPICRFPPPHHKPPHHKPPHHPPPHHGGPGGGPHHPPPSHQPPYEGGPEGPPHDSHPTAGPVFPQYH